MYVGYINSVYQTSARKSCNLTQEQINLDCLICKLKETEISLELLVATASPLGIMN